MRELHIDGMTFVEKPVITCDKLLAFVLPNRLLNPAFYVFNGGNIPDTRAIHGNRVAYNGRTVLTGELQEFIFKDNFRRAYGIEFENADDWDQAHAINEWVYLLNDKLAYCNFAGSYHRKVPLANLNMSADWPLLNQLSFPGIIELVDDKIYDDDRTVHFFGWPVRKFFVVNAFEFEKYPSVDYPYRWPRPVIIRWPQLNNGFYGSEPFGQFRAHFRMPTVLNGTNEGFIGAHLVRVLKPGELIPTPFTKDWGS